jgi:polysaccharide export outer membrane protein
MERAMKIRQTKSAIRAIVAIAGMTGLVLACASRPTEVPPEDPAPGAAAAPYVIGSHDLLRISVWQTSSFPVDVPVRPDGKISVPLADDIVAAGRTPEELKKDIARKLSKHLESPDVTVIVLEMNSRFVSVVGRVAKSSRLPLSENMRVVEAIALAGGFDEFADSDDIRVVRHLPDGKEVEYHFDYDAYMSGSKPSTNFLLEPGDVIYVPD